ncbi:endocuticle structural glycoprotein SgAbd-3-like [Daphnia pulex]|nr:endocuticle structural glycoprotein SgAbd-3-like [Daphnia pulex]
MVSHSPVSSPRQLQSSSKMKFIILFAFLAVALAAPQRRPQSTLTAPRRPQASPQAQRPGIKTPEGEPIAIISSNSEMNADGSYSFDFESADGTRVQESGNQKKVGPKPEDIGTVSRGSYSYTSPDGVVLSINWTADENGFQAAGDHLPTPPPMPEHVVKMLADLRARGLL